MSARLITAGHPIQLENTLPARLNIASPGSEYGIQSPVVAQTVLFTEDATSTTHTGSVVIPAGSILLDIIVQSTVLWTDSSATLKVGDSVDDDGWFTGVELDATDLLVGEKLQASSDNFWGGKNGVYLTTAGRFGTTTGAGIGGTYTSAGIVTGVVSVTTPSGTAGRTYMTVLYAPTLEDRCLIKAATA